MNIVDEIEAFALHKIFNAGRPYLGEMVISKRFSWMTDDNYGVDSEQQIKWRYFEHVIRNRFVYEDEAQENLHTFLQQEQAKIGTFLDTLAKTVNESYYGCDNAEFYKIRMILGQTGMKQAQYFLSNAKAAKRKPTAIKNGSCNDAALEFQQLLYTLKMEPTLWTQNASARFDLPSEYVSEHERYFHHAMTAVYDDSKNWWCLVNSATPRNSDTIIAKSHLPQYTVYEHLE